MSSLLEFLQKERKLNWKFWFKYYHQHLLEFIYSKKMKSDNSWKRIKLQSSVFPENMPKELELPYLWNSTHKNKQGEQGIFKYLSKEYEGTFMKRFKD